jgi:hypothetical protein
MHKRQVIYSLQGPLPWEKLGYASGSPGAGFEGLVRSDPLIHDRVAKLGHPHALTPPLNLELLRVQNISVRLDGNAESVVYTPEVTPDLQHSLDLLNALQSARHAPLLPALEPTVISAAAAPAAPAAPAKAPGTAAPNKAKACVCVRCDPTPAVGFVNLRGDKEIPVCAACRIWTVRQRETREPTLAALKARPTHADPNPVF